MGYLTKYEKETILLTSEGDGTYSVYTFNPSLKRKLAEYSQKYPRALPVDRFYSGRQRNL